MAKSGKFSESERWTMKDVRIESKPLRDGIELTLIGELLFADSAEFMQKIPERVRDKGKVVVFNMAKLKFIDSSGLGAILYISQACQMQNQQVQLINANPDVNKSLMTIKKVGTFQIV